MRTATPSPPFGLGVAVAMLAGATVAQGFPRLPPSAASAALLALALAGALTLYLGLSAHAGPPQPGTGQVAAMGAPSSATSPAATSPTATPAPVAPAAPATDLGPILPASEPVGLDIPSIDVHAKTLVPLTVGPDGVLPPPSDYAQAGWYTGGPNPGQLGPAVIAGHVDGPNGPAIFYRLGTLTPGAQVNVTRADGVVATFTIDSISSYSKTQFPTSLVYGNTTNRAELRLITCGGAYDRTTGHYVDNIIAFGHLNAA